MKAVASQRETTSEIFNIKGKNMMGVLKDSKERSDDEYSLES